MTYYQKFLFGIVLVTLASPAHAQQMRNGLPPTNTDSFVQQAGEKQEDIYGDEGFAGPPPFYGFTSDHRINSGITGRRDMGLTTGHGSYLPDAWGADEFLAPPDGEWSLAGNNGGDRANNHGAAFLDAWDALDPARSAYFDQQLAARQALRNRQMAPNAPQAAGNSFPFASTSTSQLERTFAGQGADSQSALPVNYDVASKFYSPTSTWDIGGKKYMVDYGTPQSPKAVYIPVSF